jgi:hypothetical protein
MTRKTAQDSSSLYNDQWQTTANTETRSVVNTLNAELNPICHLLALLGVHHFLHFSRIRVKQVGELLV